MICRRYSTCLLKDDNGKKVQCPCTCYSKSCDSELPKERHLRVKTSRAKHLLSQFKVEE